MKKIILLLLLTFLTGCNPLSPRVIEKADSLEKVKIIENSFPLLEEYEIRSLSTKKFKGIVYNNGAYGDSNCNYANCQEFTEESKNIFNKVTDLLEGSEVTGFFNLSYENGKLKRGYFDFPSYNFNDRFRYIYKPNNNTKDSKHPYCAGELWWMKINDDWYFECEDWN